MIFVGSNFSFDQAVTTDEGVSYFQFKTFCCCGAQNDFKSLLVYFSLSQLGLVLINVFRVCPQYAVSTVIVAIRHGNGILYQGMIEQLFGVLQLDIPCGSINM